MLNQDENMLMNLVQDYSIQEIVQSLAVIASEKAGDFSDMGLTDQARKMVQLSLCLEKISSELK